MSNTIEFNDKLHELLDLIYPNFKDRFLKKFVVSGNPSQTAKGLIERAEYYNMRYNNNGSEE